MTTKAEGIKASATRKPPSAWLYLSEHWPAVKVHLRVLSAGHWGRTVWTDDGPVIYLSYQLGRIARRVTLAHEIAHLELGQPASVECPENETRAVDWAARFLLPDIKALGRLLALHDVREAARVAKVTRTVVMDRLDSMTAAEREVLGVILAKGIVAA